MPSFVIIVAPNKRNHHLLLLRAQRSALDRSIARPREALSPSSQSALRLARFANEMWDHFFEFSFLFWGGEFRVLWCGKRGVKRSSLFFYYNYLDYPTSRRPRRHHVGKMRSNYLLLLLFSAIIFATPFNSRLMSSKLVNVMAAAGVVLNRFVPTPR